MSNPFEYFNASDDDEPKTTQVKKEEKHKLTHAEKRAYKKQQEENAKRAAEIAEQAKRAPAQQALPERVKDNHRRGHDMPRDKQRELTKKTWREKDTTGHYLDRRSGTGREDRPRKAGGGYGNVGNLKDQREQDKYIKEGEEKSPEAEKPAEEQTEEAAEIAEPEPEKLTLDEYYKNKGVDLTYQAQQKGPVKKQDINADWIKKEKLTLLKTKEDLKNEEKKIQPASRTTGPSSGIDVEENKLNLVGFGSKPLPKDTQKTNERREDNKRGGKKNKLQFSNEDFPSL